MEDVFELMKVRHSVRRYLNKPIEEEKAESIKTEIEKINSESGLHFELYLENEEVFKANEPKYGYFSGCRNFFALYGNNGDDEKVGYYGERLVLFCQRLGLNTCWVALTFEKSKVAPTLPSGKKLHDVIALGYGETQGTPHKSKPIDKLCKLTENTPEWFRRGMEAAIFAPTAINQQRFYFELVGENKVKAKALLGPCYKTDIGIVKYHFELGAGKENFEWI